MSGITHRHAGLNQICHVLTICPSVSVLACSLIHFTLARSLSHKETVLFYKPAEHKLMESDSETAGRGIWSLSGDEQRLLVCADTRGNKSGWEIKEGNASGFSSRRGIQRVTQWTGPMTDCTGDHVGIEGTMNYHKYSIAWQGLAPRELITQMSCSNCLIHIHVAQGA